MVAKLVNNTDFCDNSGSVNGADVWHRVAWYPDDQR